MHVTVVGAQWGDEGKGKVVDWLNARADAVVRFQGGHNAGHTLVVEGVVYKLSLLPSGVVRKGKQSLIASGVVVDPWALLTEIETLRQGGLALEAGDLYLCSGATLILPFYAQLDDLREQKALGDNTDIGTTRRGIGPAYEDKVGRRALRLRDILALSNAEKARNLKKKIHILLAHHNALRAYFGAAPLKEEEVFDQLSAVSEHLTPFIAIGWRLLKQWHEAGKTLLFEGAQGFLLDVEHGTYPYVTSSNTHPCAAAVGSGIPREMLGTIIGLVKAYMTRVGKGPFPTELHDDIAHWLGEKGKEFGTVTGRRRRCGWFDAVLTRQAICMSGIQAVVLTKLDILDGLEEVKIAIAYEHKGTRYDYWPYFDDETLQKHNMEPVYETLPGWQENTQGLRHFKDYPPNAQRYIRRIEKLLGVPICLISTSPHREDMIVMNDPFSSS